MLCRRAPFLPCGRKNNSWRNTARGRPLSQGVPSSKTVHWTVFEFTPGTRDFVRSISPSADGEQRLVSPTGSVGASQPSAERCPPDTRAPWTPPPLKRRAKLCASVPPRLLFRTRVTKYPYGCRVSGANDYANCTKCKGPGSLLPGEVRASSPGRSGRQPNTGGTPAPKSTILIFVFDCKIIILYNRNVRLLSEYSDQDKSLIA